MLDGSKARVESALAHEVQSAKGVEAEGDKRDFIAHLLSSPKGRLDDDSTPRRSLTLRDISLE